MDHPHVQVFIGEDVKLDQLVRARDCVSPEVVGSIPAKTPKTKNSLANLHGFELHRPCQGNNMINQK